jgi:DeoR family suf operon transcriptional repressor
MKASVTNSSKGYILQYLLKQEKATVNEIAKALDISRQATRRHLNDLEDQGLIYHNIIQPKVGRPQHEYYISEKGRDHFPHRYDEFALSFLDTLTETLGENQLSQVLRKQWQRKAQAYLQSIQGKNVQEKVKKLVEIRHREGYMAELFSLEDHESKKQKFFISEHHCAISDVAESYPQVCGHELEMFVALFPDCKVERTSWINNGEHLCGYLIETK